MPHIVTLCTGNAARSVIAGAILTAGAPDLDVSTRGTAVIEGLVMSWRTRAALEGLGLQNNDHRSRQLTAADLAGADLVIALSREHVEYVRRVHPDAAPRTATLRRVARDLPAGAESLQGRLATLDLANVELEPWEDIDDPVSGEVDEFHRCAIEIEALLAQLLPRLTADTGART